MKNQKLKINALILVLVLALSGQSFAHKYYHSANEKKVVVLQMTSPILKIIPKNTEFSTEELMSFRVNMKMENFFLINNDYKELVFSIIDSKKNHSFTHFEAANDAVNLEDWMFEDNYLETEAAPLIEGWMFEDYYLETETAPLIEDWMFEDNYLETETAPFIEDWMFEDNYLETVAGPKIEDWMLEDNYLSTEAIPAIEDWMMDTEYYSSPW